GRLCTITYAVISFISLIAGLVPIIWKLDKIVAGIIVCVLYLVQFFSVFVVIGVTDGIVAREFNKDGTRKVGEFE
ncbi:MAG: hypothetical protein K2N38_03685, partial [Oscillospiraceae bacterium]|nr:hypothetical protein [Oscillospiraceae bacterium]